MLNIGSNNCHFQLMPDGKIYCSICVKYFVSHKLGYADSRCKFVSGAITVTGWSLRRHLKTG